VKSSATVIFQFGMGGSEWEGLGSGVVNGRFMMINRLRSGFHAAGQSIDLDQSISLPATRLDRAWPLFTAK